MYTVTHGVLDAKTGEPVRITFTITDQDGDSVAVSGASATYKIARRAGDAALVTKTEADGITLSGNTAVVEFSTEELADEDDEPLIGDFFAQLKITKAGIGLIVAEGPLSIGSVIT